MESKKSVGSGPKPYVGREQARSAVSFKAGRTGAYVGMGKIAKAVGVDVRELRNCAQGHGIVPDKTTRSCDMFSQDKADKIIQACGARL